MERIISLTLLCTLMPCSALAAQPAASTGDKNEFSGMADYYHHSLYGRKTSSGQVLQKHLLTAAHRTLPFGTMVHVKNHRNGRSCVVVINDRGPFTKSKVIDLSHQAATELNMISAGTVKVGCTVVDKSKLASLQAKKPVEKLKTDGNVEKVCAEKPKSEAKILVASKGPSTTLLDSKPCTVNGTLKNTAVKPTGAETSKTETADEPTDENRILWTTDQ